MRPARRWIGGAFQATIDPLYRQRGGGGGVGGDRRSLRLFADDGPSAGIAGPSLR